jgi:hypothetical protein
VDGKTYTSTPGGGALWLLRLPAAPASASPFSLTLASTANASQALILEDLLLGDVFLCAGQSNVGAVQVGAMANASDLVAQAAGLTALRIYQVSGNAQSNVSLNEFPTDGLVPWQAPLAGGSNATLLGFSAVCWILGTTLQGEHLGSAVPVGLLHSSHGGTSIQAWLSPAAAPCGDNANSWPSSVLYNSNIHPLTLGPVALKSVYYYQVRVCIRRFFSPALLRPHQPLTLPPPPPPPPPTHTRCAGRAGLRHWRQRDVLARAVVGVLHSGPHCRLARSAGQWAALFCGAAAARVAAH